MAGGASVKDLSQVQREEELRRKEALQKVGNLAQVPTSSSPDIEPINKEQPKSILDASMAFFGMGTEPDVQSYEDYQKKKQLPGFLDKVGGAIMGATDALTGAGKAVGEAAGDIKYQLVTPKYEQEEDRKRGRKK